MTADQAMERPYCEHYWASHHQPDFPREIPYVRICHLCGAVDGADLAREIGPLVTLKAKLDAVRKVRDLWDLIAKNANWDEQRTIAPFVKDLDVALNG